MLAEPARVVCLAHVIETLHRYGHSEIMLMLAAA